MLLGGTTRTYFAGYPSGVQSSAGKCMVMHLKRASFDLKNAKITPAKIKASSYVSRELLLTARITSERIC